MENTQALAAPLGFPVAHSVTRVDADRLGAWWDDSRNFIQPSEFILSRRGKVMMSTYSNSPIGRMEPEETLTLLRYLNSQRQK